MEKWKWTCLILCFYGLLTKFRPSEQFITEYLIQFKNISTDTIVQEIYPISTYSNLATLPIIFLITDFLRYKSILIFGALVYILTWILLIASQSQQMLKVVQVLYGLSSSTEIAYFTYIYAQVNRDHYKKVTSYTRSAILMGKFLSGIFSQICVTYNLINYQGLNYISLGSLTVAFIFSFFLPNVQESFYFYKNASLAPSHEQNSKLEESTIKLRIQAAYPVLWNDFKSAFSNLYVLKWSFWWSISTAIDLQVLNYIQPLWEEIMPYTNGDIFNGYVGAIHTILSAICTIILGYSQIRWKKWGEMFLSILSICQGIILITISQTNHLYVGYIGYIFYRILFQILITIASSEVSLSINPDCHGLIFGFNTFIALILQTLLTIIVTDSRGFLVLNTRYQFMVYGSGCVLLGILFIMVFLHQLIIQRYKK